MPTPSPPPVPPTFRPNLTALPSVVHVPRRPPRPQAQGRAGRRGGRASSRAGAAAVCLFRQRLLPRARAAAEADRPRGRAPAAAGGSAGWEKNPSKGRRAGAAASGCAEPRTHGRRPESCDLPPRSAGPVYTSQRRPRADGSEPGQAVQDQGNQAAVKNVHETTSRRLEQTETGGPMVIQRLKSSVRGIEVINPILMDRQ